MCRECMSIWASALIGWVIICESHRKMLWKGEQHSERTTLGARKALAFVWANRYETNCSPDKHAGSCLSELPVWAISPGCVCVCPGCMFLLASAVSGYSIVSSIHHQAVKALQNLLRKCRSILGRNWDRTTIPFQTRRIAFIHPK